MTAEAVSTRGGWWCASCDPISSHPLRARTAFFSDKLIFFWFFSQFPPFPPPHSQRGRREPQTHKKYWLCSLPGECEALPLPVTISDTDTGVVKGEKKKKSAHTRQCWRQFTCIHTRQQNTLPSVLAPAKTHFFSSHIHTHNGEITHWQKH